MTDLVASIQEFAALSIMRLKGELGVEDRDRLQSLEDLLRDSIDGAHPAPRRIENPAPASPSAVRSVVKPAKVVVNKRPSLDADLPLGEKDREKITAIRETDIPRSSYTPSAAPAYLEEYYGASITRTEKVSEPPKRVVGAEGARPSIADEVKLLFGMVTVPPPPPMVEGRRTVSAAPGPDVGRPTAPPRVTPVPVARAASSSPAGPPAVVHFLNGGSKRGELLAFDADAGVLSIRPPQAEPEDVPLNDVLTVFIGIAKGQTPEPPSGTKMIVKLLNHKELRGMSPDYAQGAAAMTLIPDDRRNVDRVWIPAWSVAEIRFA
jgi:hypothetical protein